MDTCSRSLQIPPFDGRQSKRRRRGNRVGRPYAAINPRGSRENSPFSFVSLEMVKNNLNRRNPTYVTTLQNTHLRAHVTRHDQQRIPPIEYP